MDNIYAASPTVALLAAVVIQGLKRSEWFPWISRETERANNVLGALVAALTGIGLAVAFDWDQETGRFAVGFSGNAYDLLHVAVHAPLQWAQQHGFYKAFIALPESAGETRDLLRALVAAQSQTKPVPRAEAQALAKHRVDVHGTIMDGD